MRIFIATLSTETNTFSTMPTAMSGYEAYYLRHGNATSDPPNLMTEALHEWRNKAEGLGWEVVESLAAIAEPAGPTTSPTYNVLRNEILSDLKNAGGADIILLQLHGAMIAEDVEDTEGDIAAAVRQMCPEAVIGLALDQHCHLTAKMMENCDLIICFKEYPHDDATARARELFDLAHRTFSGEISPVMRDFDCRMIHLFLTKTGAMRKFVDQLVEMESEPGILSVSLAHGFPWADVERVGSRMLVIADNDPALAAEVAERLGRQFFELRHEVTGSFVEIQPALDAAEKEPAGPVVLADMGDNSGGGAPGDSTFLLREMLDRGFSNVASGLYWDPVAVQICVDAGKGSDLELRIGGKVCADSGDPVDLRVRVMNIAYGIGQHLGAGLEPMGTVVWLRTGEEFDILINDLRTQVYHPEAFEQLGIDLSRKSIVTVKSLFHFYGPFERIASKIIQVATPGGTNPAFQDIAYTKRDGNYWPRVENPFEQ